MILFAHTGSSLDDESTWQLLEDHLSAVADRASTFAAEFGAGAWGRAIGILHDAGKASCAFQRRLHGSDTHVDHSTAGAKVALDCYGDITGRMMAYICSGHHAGLSNGIVRSRGEIPGSLTPLEERLAASVEPYDGFSDLLDSSDRLALPAMAELEPIPAPRQLSKPENAKRAQRFSAYAFARMLYSSLVDADYLDTERFMAPEIARVRVSRERSDIPHLLDQLLEALDQIVSEDTPVNRARQAVLTDCLAASGEEPGLFSLTVPTGGGKTLSSLAFALAHAKRYDMNRVIIAIPFTSIVEQTAAVLKDIFGPDVVLEHHSGYDFSDLDDEAGYAQRLATQNWDAPIVVTTNVQLLESFFANKPAKSRKIHNFVKSVIILDEAQTLPDGLLSASLAALESLTFSYGSSVVLCTATQPALDLALPFGSAPREIVEHDELFQEAFDNRVAYQNLGMLEEEQLVEFLTEREQVLCIVGTKDGARRIYRDLVRRAVGEGALADEGEAMVEGFFHLSAAMTPSHRSEVLSRIKERLRLGQRCMVVATQVVEAGVDVDFPVVYRELAGVDSLVQAAGRCNREGKGDTGAVRIFEYTIDGEVQENGPWLERMKSISRMVIRENGGAVSAELVRPFFEYRYRDKECLDEKGIYVSLTDKSMLSSGFKAIPFEQVALNYRIIAEDTVPIFIPRGNEETAELERLRTAENPSAQAMRLQRYSVSIPRWRLREYKNAEALERIEPFWVLREDRLQDFYREDVGLAKPGEEECRPLFF